MEARIESMGYEVGYRLVERACQRRWMGGDQLEAIKFVCKDLWSDVRTAVDQAIKVFVDTAFSFSHGGVLRSKIFTLLSGDPKHSERSSISSVRLAVCLSPNNRMTMNQHGALELPLTTRWRCLFPPLRFSSAVYERRPISCFSISVAPQDLGAFRYSATEIPLQKVFPFNVRGQVSVPSALDLECIQAVL